MACDRRVGFFAAALILTVAALNSCTKKAPEKYVLQIPAGLDSSAVVIPADNPLTREKVQLGRELYFDERLSVDGTISCASCHVPLLGFSDGRVRSIGVYGLRTDRGAPPAINRAMGKQQFWDGSANSLEEVVLAHIQNENEMRNTLQNVVRRISADARYSAAFGRVFARPVSAEDVARAIAAFTRTIFSGNSPYDRYIAGDADALSESAKRGLQLFMSERVNCTACHAGPNFSDEKFHSNGAGMASGSPDPGRFTQTGEQSDHGLFKTPTLREIARTSPYMHDGSLTSLKEVVQFYNRGGIANPNLSKHVKPLHLTQQEQEDLVNFLRSLSGRNIVLPKNS